MSFTIQIGLKVSPFELHHGRKPRTESTNKIKDKSYLCDRTTLNVSVPSKQIPIYVARNEKRRIDGPYNHAQEEKYSHAERHTNHRREGRQNRLVRISCTHIHFLRNNQKESHWNGNTKNNRELP